MSWQAPGRAAGRSPTGTVVVLAIVLALIPGGWPYAAGLVFIVLVGIAVHDALVDWWESLGFLRRTGVYTGGLGSLVVATTVNLSWLFAAVGLVILSFVGWGLWRWWSDRELRRHYRRYLLPLHLALAPIFKLDPDLFHPTSWLTVPLDRLDGPGGITVLMPTDRLPTELQQEEILRIVRTKLDIRGDAHTWRLDGENRFLHLYPKPDSTVPALVPWDDEWRSLLSRNTADRWYVGRTTGGRPYWLDPQQENPHILLSCLTGWGKTNAMGVIIADHLHRGFEVVICDAKFGSMPHFADLPGVTYARTIREIHDVLIRIGAESERRRGVLGDAQWDKPPTFDRLLVIVEETNTTIEELNAFWKEERAWLMHEARENGERIFLAPSSPALRAYRQLGYMGREIRINLLVISQRAEANAVGGSAIRNQLGTKVLGWPDIPDWNMHAKSHPFRQTTGEPGHSFIVRLGKVDEVQWTFADRGDLRDWATSGRKPVTTIGLPGSQVGRKSSHLEVPVGAVLGGGVPPDPDDAPITLRQAIDEGVIVGIGLSSLQRYSRPSASVGFPNPVTSDGKAHLYDREAVRSWGAMWKAGEREMADGNERTE